MKKNIFIIIVSIGTAISCSKSTGGGGGGGGGGGSLDCTSVPKSFSADVNPIVQTFCNTTGCHAAGSVNGPGPITNYTQVFANRVAIRAAIAAGTMPQSGTLTTAQKNSFLCWIDSGAPNN
jgi:hypothetical protein